MESNTAARASSFNLVKVQSLVAKCCKMQKKKPHGVKALYHPKAKCFVNICSFHNVSQLNFTCSLLILRNSFKLWLDFVPLSLIKT